MKNQHLFIIGILALFVIILAPKLGLFSVIPYPIVTFPVNDAVYSTTNITLQVTSNQPIDNWFYRLNSNTILSFRNGDSITAREGENILVIYSSNANGTGYASIRFYVNFTAPSQIVIYRLTNVFDTSCKQMMIEPSARTSKDYDTVNQCWSAWENRDRCGNNICDGTETGQSCIYDCNRCVLNDVSCSGKLASVCEDTLTNWTGGNMLLYKGYVVGKCGVECLTNTNCKVYTVMEYTNTCRGNAVVRSSQLPVCKDYVCATEITETITNCSSEQVCINGNCLSKTCSANEAKCSGTEFFKCEGNSWVNKGYNQSCDTQMQVYRISNNECKSYNIYTKDKLTTDYLTLSTCQAKLVEEPTQSFWEQYQYWIIGIGGVLLLLILFRRK